MSNLSFFQHDLKSIASKASSTNMALRLSFLSATKTKSSQTQKYENRGDQLAEEFFWCQWKIVSANICALRKASDVAFCNFVDEVKIDLKHESGIYNEHHEVFFFLNFLKLQMKIRILMNGSGYLYVHHLKEAELGLGFFVRTSTKVVFSGARWFFRCFDFRGSYNTSRRWRQVTS